MSRIVGFLLFLIVFVSTGVGQTWEIYNSENSSLPEGKVNAVFVDVFGAKWFGTNSGLVQLTEGVWNSFTTEDGLVSNTVNGISGIEQGEDMLLYISTPQGVSEISLLESGSITFESYNASNSGLHSDSIASILPETDVVYFGTPSGLNINDVESWTFFDQINTSTSEGDVSLKDINTMALTPHGWNYIGTEDEGVRRIQYDVDGITGASTYNTEWSGLPSDQINDIYINKEGNQWYATSNGVAYHLGYETKKNWATYTQQSSELISNMVYVIAEDGNGITWAGTDRGISKFDGNNWVSYPAVNEIVEYAVFDLAVDIDESVWFATDFGMLHLKYPNKVESGTNAVVSNIHVFPTISNKQFTIRYNLLINSHVSIFVLDMTGRIVRHLSDHRVGLVPNTLYWNINDTENKLPNGSYIIAAKTEKEFLTQKIIIVR